MADHTPHDPAGAAAGGELGDLDDGDRAVPAATLLYHAHAQVRMDTDADTDLQHRVLALARELLPGVDAADRRLAADDGDDGDDATNC